jgi:hypothetical protein
MKTEKTVSMEISMGREVVVGGVLCEDKEDSDAALIEWRAECSWAE